MLLRLRCSRLVQTSGANLAANIRCHLLLAVRRTLMLCSFIILQFALVLNLRATDYERKEENYFAAYFPI